MPLSPARRRFRIGLAALVLAGLGVAGYLAWRSRQGLPLAGSAAYEEYVAAFGVGTAALDSGLWLMATEKLTIAIDKIPQEPAAWANRGLLHLRANQPAKARAALERAARLAPDNADIEEMLGYLAESEGKL